MLHRHWMTCAALLKIFEHVCTHKQLTRVKKHERPGWYGTPYAVRHRYAGEIALVRHPEGSAVVIIASRQLKSFARMKKRASSVRRASCAGI